jgi:hypothetical protein
LKSIVKKGNAWTIEGLSSFDYGGGQTIIKLAEERGDTDLAQRVCGFDLFAKEAKYHTTCRRNYTVPTLITMDFTEMLVVSGHTQPAFDVKNQLLV